MSLAIHFFDKFKMEFGDDEKHYNLSNIENIKIASVDRQGRRINSVEYVTYTFKDKSALIIGTNGYIGFECRI